MSAYLRSYWIRKCWGKWHHVASWLIPQPWLTQTMAPHPSHHQAVPGSGCLPGRSADSWQYPRDVQVCPCQSWVRLRVKDAPQGQQWEIHTVQSFQHLNHLFLCEGLFWAPLLSANSCAYLSGIPTMPPVTEAMQWDHSPGTPGLPWSMGPMQVMLCVWELFHPRGLPLLP